jgi:hypothetical protein
MHPPLCAYVSPKPERIPCPAFAAPGNQFCPVHRDIDLYTRVPKSRKHDAKPLECARCHETIAAGTLQRATPLGPVHAEFLCEPKP